tara:strand:- start:2380 stop:2643 length:264 start_codon:yes stop_codon:yes gene_type:complete
MIFSLLGYIFYFVAVVAGYLAAYGLLVQVFPDYSILHIIVGGVVSLMFFPLIPLYPGIMLGDWTLAVICYISILLGVILTKEGRKVK